MKKLIGAFYGRFSSDKQRDESIDDQLRVCLRHAEREGIEIPEKYRFGDKAMSGRLHKRPGLQQLKLALHESPDIDVVIVDEISRLSRNDLQTLYTYYQLTNENKGLIAVSDSIDTRKDVNAKVQIFFRAMMNDMALQVIRNETKRGQLGQKERGRSAGENVYGYETVPDGNIIYKKGIKRPEGYKHVTCVEESKVVRQIFELYLQGKSPIDIAKILNGLGIRAKRGGQWNNSTIVRILQNKKYIGVWEYNTTKTVYNQLEGTKKQVPRPRDEWHVATREDLRIITQEMWLTVQEMHEKASKPFPSRKSISLKGRNKSYIHSYPKDPMEGLMECGVCGNTIMQVAGTKGGYYGCHHGRTGACSNKVIVSKKHVDARILDQLLTEILRPEIVEAVYKKVEKEVKNYKGDIPEKLQEVSRELRKLQAEIRNFADAIGQGCYSKTVMEKLGDAEVKEVKLKIEVAGLEKAKAKIFTAPPREWVERRISKLRDLFYKNPSEAAQLLRRLTGKLVFHPIYNESGKPYYRITSKIQTLALLEEDEGSHYYSSNSVYWWRRRESKARVVYAF